MATLVVYYLLILALITVGAAAGGPHSVTWLVLPVGLIAVVFQRYAHHEPLRELGFRWPRPIHLGEAVFLPAAVIAAVVLFDVAMGWLEVPALETVPHPLHPGRRGISPAGLAGVLALTTVVTCFGALVTEELAFRGYLISRLRRRGSLLALLASSVMFGLWHLPPSLFFLHGEGAVRAVYVIDIALLGVVLGGLFLRSGSLLPCALLHGVWNALDYTLFGFGDTPGILPGTERVLFDPDEGVAGTIFLLIVAAWSTARGLQAEGGRREAEGGR